jgi:flagellar basal body-associated protein FliL
MAEEEKKELEAAEPPPARGGKSSFLMILVAAGLAAVMSMGGTMLVASRLLAKVASASQSDHGGKSKKSGKKEKGKKEERSTGDTFNYSLNEMIVNLADPERFARVSLVAIVEGNMAAAQEAEGAGGGHGGGEEEIADNGLPPIPEAQEMEAKNPILRDAAIQVFNTLTYQDLLTPRGKAAARAALVKALNECLEEAVVRDVRFTSLVMQ